MLGVIDPQKLIKHVITQEHCSRVVDEEEGIDEFLKDLSLLGRDLSRVVYFDSKVLSPWLQPDNYFPL